MHSGTRCLSPSSCGWKAAAGSATSSGPRLSFTTPPMESARWSRGCLRAWAATGTHPALRFRWNIASLTLPTDIQVLACPVARSNLQCSSRLQSVSHCATLACSSCHCGQLGCLCCVQYSNIFFVVRCARDAFCFQALLLCVPTACLFVIQGADQPADEPRQQL